MQSVGNPEPQCVELRNGDVDWPLPIACRTSVRRGRESLPGLILQVSAVQGDAAPDSGHASIGSEASMPIQCIARPTKMWSIGRPPGKSRCSHRIAHNNVVLARRERYHFASRRWREISRVGGESRGGFAPPQHVEQTRSRIQPELLSDAGEQLFDVRRGACSGTIECAAIESFCHLLRLSITNDHGASAPELEIEIRGDVPPPRKIALPKIDVARLTC